MTGTLMLHERPLSLPLDVRVSASVARSSLLWFVIMVLHETVYLLVAFLSVCGIFVTSQLGNEALRALETLPTPQRGGIVKPSTRLTPRSCRSCPGVVYFECDTGPGDDS